MDEVKKDKEIISADFVYSFKDIMVAHDLTADQTVFILCEFHNIEY